MSRAAEPWPGPAVTRVASTLAHCCVLIGVGMWLVGCADTPPPPAAARRAAPPAFTVRDSTAFSRLIELKPGDPLVVTLRDLSPLKATIYLWDEGAGLQLSRGARLSHLNRHDRPQRVRVLLVGEGTGELVINREATPVTVESDRQPVAGGPGYRYETAAPAGGSTRRTLMVGLDDTGRLVAVGTGGDEPAGAMPVLASDAVRELVVATADGEPVNVYINDPEDADGDGLGATLERALSTCDAPGQPGCGGSLLADYYFTVDGATRDTDRDGLSDRDELLGVPGKDGRPPLDLPRWGADPRHKDAFVEVDFAGKLGHVGVTEQDLVQVAELYAKGSARALRNPDGLPGVRLHFDVGFSPSDPDNAGLLGDWGGSERSRTGKYKRARKQHLTPGRAGYFRYALAGRAGTGQSHRDAFSFNHYYHRIPVIAHELAHTFGLKHYGHEYWGRANCKPNYVSIMNYLYQNQVEVGFSTDQVVPLDPAEVTERDSLGQLDPERLRAPPLELDVDGHGVDWNRDGLISQVPVRAPLTRATFKSCAEPRSARSTLASGRLAPTSPALVRVGRRLLALWVGEAGRVYAARAGLTAGPDGQGSCPQGDHLGSPCMRMGRPTPIQGTSGVRHVAALASPTADTSGRDAPDDVLLALAGRDGQLRWGNLRVPSGRAAAPVLTDLRPLPGAYMSDQPAIVQHAVSSLRYGDRRAVSVLYRGPADGYLHEVRFPASSFFGPAGHARAGAYRQLARDAAGEPIPLGLAPAAVELGTGELCGAFPDWDEHVHFYCYEPESDSWRDLSEVAFYGRVGPRTEGPVALAYHYFRGADGRPVAPGTRRGAVYLAFSAADDEREPRAAWWLTSEWLSNEHGAAERIRFRWRSRIIDQWTSHPEGAGVALYEDATLSSLSALVPVAGRKPTPDRLALFPLADGAFHAQLAGGDDFEVMERGICLGLAGEERCGGPETAAY